MFIDPAEELLLVNKKLATKLPYNLVEAIAVAIEQQLPDGLLLEGGRSLAQLLHSNKHSGRGRKGLDGICRLGVRLKAVELRYGYDRQA